MTDRQKRILPFFVHAPADEWITEAKQKQINQKKLEELTYLVNLPLTDGTCNED